MVIACNVVTVPIQGFQREWLYETMTERIRSRAIYDSTPEENLVRSSRLKGNRSRAIYDSTSTRQQERISYNLQDRKEIDLVRSTTPHREKISYDLQD